MTVFKVTSVSFNLLVDGFPHIPVRDAEQPTKMKIGELEKVIRTVEAVYQRILAGARCKADFHRDYQQFLVGLAWDFGYIGLAEFKVEHARSDGRSGSIDVAWLDNNRRPILVIEVDSASRQKSLNKLGLVPDCARLWVYYGNREDGELRARLEFPTEISLVCLPYTGRHGFDEPFIRKSRRVARRAGRS